MKKKPGLVQFSDLTYAPIRAGEPPVVDTNKSTQVHLPAKDALERFAALAPAAFVYCHETRTLQGIWQPIETPLAIYRVVTVSGLVPAAFSRFFNVRWRAYFDLKDVATDTGARTFEVKPQFRGKLVQLSPRPKGAPASTPAAPEGPAPADTVAAAIADQVLAGSPPPTTERT